MFKIIDNTIHLTRGDIGTLEISTIDEATKEPYVFKTGDVVKKTKHNIGNLRREGLTLGERL